MVENSNPLNKYFRQPSIYISLPSGNTYPPHVIETTQTGELAVMPMTAKDEIKFKTPDALLNGEATVQVIQSCIPQIKNAWAMPSIDCDAALIAIRMATYGESMTLPVTVPGTKIEKDLELNLQETLTTILGATYNDTFLYENMEIKTRPLSYAEFTASALKQFEQSRLQSVINDTQMTDEEKIREFTATKSLF
mgnify:CR=1 FL=1